MEDRFPLRVDVDGMTEGGSPRWPDFSSASWLHGPTGLSQYIGAQERMTAEEYSKIENKIKTKVLVLFTGGTIGMAPVDGKLSPSSGTILKYMKKYYKFVEKKEKWGDEFSLEGDGLFYCQTLAASFQLLEYDVLLDSSAMKPDGWNKMMNSIFSLYDKYDSFVILHGTDTMAYTSSALSFGFINLRKLVVITGSQIPLTDRGRNDGIDNLLNSLYIAGNDVYSRHIPEVCLCFNRKLFRGSRVTKVSADRFNAFDSPNYPVLMSLGVSEKVRWNCVRAQPKKGQKFTILPFFYASQGKEFGILHLYPGIRKQVQNMVERDDYHGVVVLSFGSGNYNPELEPHFTVMQKRGTILVNISQCTSGKVQLLYATCGESIIPGADMTTEAAYCKMIHLFSYDLQADEKEEQRMSVEKYEFFSRELQKNLRGELSLKGWNKIDAPHYSGRIDDRRDDENLSNK